MAESEILNMISAEKLAEIKLKDPKPLFKAFVIGHEGEAKANMVGVGTVVKTWFKSTIEKLHDKIKIGLNLFNGHSDDNQTDGRISIGEIVGKTTKEIGDKFSSIIATWIKPSYKNLPLDVASIEADVAFEQDSNNGLYVADVGEVSGVALGNSAIDKPGFPGATLLGSIQAFAKTKNIGDKITMLTPEEIKQAILEAKLRPSDLFTQDGLIADPLIMEHVREKIANPDGFLSRRISKDLVESEKRAAELERINKELEGKLTKQGESIKTLRSENATSKIGPLFETEKTKRKLEDEKAIKYIQARLPRFEVKNPEELEKEFSDYLDVEVDEYKKIAKDVFGVDDKPEEKKGGGEPDEKEKSEADNKYLDPAQNPMIQTE
jgi:hypothetical protein